MATSRLFSLLGPSIIRRFSHVTSLEVNKICLLPSLRFKRYSSSALRLDSVSSSLTIGNTSAGYAHPWPEWVNFIDGLKAKGYLTSNAANDGDNEGLAVYTDMKLVKVACLSFARDRFDIFKSLSAQDVQTIVEKGCPDLNRKYVNSAKRLRAHLELDEGDVCGSCNLRGSCDRAYVMVNDDSEAAARTVDVVRILLFYALDPLVFSEENKPPGRELIESSARKLLQQLIELGETHPNPDLPKPASTTSQRKKQPLDLSVNKSSKSDEMKEGYWMCTKCNSMNLARNKQCLKCKAVGPKIKSVSVAEVEMKKGDWNCPQCKFMNFARNIRCLKCKTEGPTNVDEVEMKKGDWNCPKCSFMNFADKKQCFRCQEPRPQRQLKPGDWECPDCDFLNFARNNICRRCNVDRPPEREYSR